MKYIEYVYLAVAIMIAITLVKEYDVLPTTSKVAFFGAIFLTTFMFGFRRIQRRQMDKYFEEEMQKLEEEEEEIVD